MSVDTTLTCRDCGATFTFTAGEQEFYASRGFDNQPSRCAACRAQRKADRDGGGSSYGGGGYSSGRRESREMFTATCASCGQDARVPFQPSGEKPVYCSACFEQRRGTSSYGSSSRY